MRRGVVTATSRDVGLVPHAKKLGKHPLRSSELAKDQLSDRGQTDREIIFDSRPDTFRQPDPDLSPRRQDPTMPSRDHPSDL